MREQPDIHARLMSYYPQGKWLAWMLGDCYQTDADPNTWFLVPGYYYACIFGMVIHQSKQQTNITCWWLLLIVISFIIASVSIELWPTGMTIWALLIALLIGELSPPPGPPNFFLQSWYLHSRSPCLCDTNRHDSSCYESTSWTQVSGSRG